MINVLRITCLYKYTSVLDADWLAIQAVGQCTLDRSLNTNKQTNALLSIKTPTMSSIINKKSQYTIDSHTNFSIGQDNAKK